LSILLLVKIFQLKKENKLLSDELSRTTVTLKHNKKTHAEFQKSIRDAEINNKFQMPRLYAEQSTTHSSMTPTVPEKYSYIRNLTEKGLSAKEIAKILSISTHEANQLVALTRLGTAA